MPILPAGSNAAILMGGVKGGSHPRQEVRKPMKWVAASCIIEPDMWKLAANNCELCCSLEMKKHASKKKKKIIQVCFFFLVRPSTQILLLFISVIMSVLQDCWSTVSKFKIVGHALENLLADYNSMLILAPILFLISRTVITNCLRLIRDTGSHGVMGLD